MTLNKVVSLLRDCQIPCPEREALNLFEAASQLSKADILTGDFQLSPSQVSRLKQLTQLRRTTPLTYLNKNQEFYGLNFYVDQSVLIPRPESEDLVDLALSLKTKIKHIYDLGCGSGCLGISYFKHAVGRSEKRIEFLDNSQQALMVARKNVRIHQIDRATFKRRDLKQLLPGYFKSKSLILANLPYLDEKQRIWYEQRCPQLKSEPAGALYAAQQGLQFYEILFRLSRRQNIHLVCETLIDQQPELVAIARRNGFKVVEQLNLATLFEPF